MRPPTTDIDAMPVTSTSIGPSYSVVVPVYNSGRTAIAAIDSVLAQSYACCELMVIDDGSTDDSAALLRARYAGATDMIRIERIANRGAAGARNQGIALCRGQWVAFLDSDDAWLPHKMQQQFELIAGEPDLVLVGALTNMRGFGGGVSDKSMVVRRVTHLDLLFRNWFQTSTVVVRRDVVESVGRFPDGQRYAEEGDFFMRVAARYPCALLNSVLVDYAGGKSGFGHSGLSAKLWRMEQGELRNIRAAWRRADVGPALALVACAYSLAKYCRRLALRALRSAVSSNNHCST